MRSSAVAQDGLHVRLWILSAKKRGDLGLSVLRLWMLVALQGPT